MAVITQAGYILGSSGFFSFSLLFELIVLVIIFYGARNVFTPIYERYKLVQYLEEAAGPTKKHWFFGHNKVINTSHSGILKRCELIATNPTMFNHWFGPLITALSFHHPDVTVPVLASNAPKNELAYSLLRPWIGDGLVTSKGKKWQRNRRLLTPAFHFNILKGYAKVADESVTVMLDKWEDCSNVSFDVFEDVSLMTLDTILRCAMSSQTDCQRAKDTHPYIKAVKVIAETYNTRLATPYLFPDFIFWRTKLGKQLKEALRVVHSHAERVIAERQQALQKSKTDIEDDRFKDETKKPRKMLDFLDILLQTRDEDGKGLTNKEIREEVDTFLLAGHDTTASGISWALYNLAKYPELQRKCRDEVMSVLGEKQSVEWNDLPKLEYLTMFIKESLRLYTPAPGTGRTLEEPLTLRSKLNKFHETVMPKGSDCFVAIYALHRNEHIWENPLEFDPERFTKENIAKRSPHAYLPFSAGSRNCIGQNFAMNEMKIALAKTLQRYRLYLDEECPEPIMEYLITLQSKNGIHVKLSRDFEDKI